MADAGIMTARVRDQCDGVVMLTMSNWHQEMRSNRYHYATRFARHLPVIFVQPVLPDPEFHYESTSMENITLLHVYQGYGWEQSTLLKKALHAKDIRTPALWVYNYNFRDFVAAADAGIRVYHATEDYFSPEFGLSHDHLNNLKTVLRMCDLLVAVSKGVKSSYVQNGGYTGKILLIENGCDFRFWSSPPEDDGSCRSHGFHPWIALYQGGIHQKVDFQLLLAIAQAMPDWTFWFCGEAYGELDGWRELSSQKNVTYWGKLNPEEVRTLAYRSTVGLIPFVQTDWITNRSFPLKAFEYVACGLPVVSVPIRSLSSFPQVITFASGPHEFMQAMRRLAPSRHDPGRIAEGLVLAKQHDYDAKFELLLASNVLTPVSWWSYYKNLRRLAVRYRTLIMSFLIGIKRKLYRRQRALILTMIHHTATGLAPILSRDSDELEVELLKLGKRVKNCGREAVKSEAT